MIAKFSLCLVVLIFAEVYSQNNAKILGYENNVDINGYRFRYETDDPITREEQGVFTLIGEKGPEGEPIGVNKVNGYASYNFPDNTAFSLTYEADELGYRPHVSFGGAAQPVNRQLPKVGRQ